ncbi:MAG TPA: hypothetical protein VNT52_13725, partial [Acidimicrobiales bacterium]|nr:hypothetical protein [Acidimicrobiales bacterium]
PLRSRHPGGRLWCVAELPEPWTERTPERLSSFDLAQALDLLGAPHRRRQVERGQPLGRPLGPGFGQLRHAPQPPTGMP